MKLRVCFKDHYPCKAETCGEYDVCKIRLAKDHYPCKAETCGEYDVCKIRLAKEEHRQKNGYIIERQ